jgi:hypothetical protein
VTATYGRDPVSLPGTGPADEHLASQNTDLRATSSLAVVLAMGHVGFAK